MDAGAEVSLTVHSRFRETRRTFRSGAFLCYGLGSLGEREPTMRTMAAEEASEFVEVVRGECCRPELPVRCALSRRRLSARVGRTACRADKGLSPADVWGILKAIVKHIGGKDGYCRNRM